MHPDRGVRTPVGIGAGALATVVLAAGLVGVRDRLAPANVALLLGLVVLAAACVGGRAAGALCGLVAATSFDFFYTRPYGSMKVTRLNDVVMAVLLVAAGVTMGRFSDRNRGLRERLRANHRDLHRLHRVGTAASDKEDERDLVLTVTAELIDALDLDQCRFERPPFASLPPGAVELPVVGRGETVGRFVLVPLPGRRPSPERLVVAETLARQLGLAFAAITPR